MLCYVNFLHNNLLPKGNFAKKLARLVPKSVTTWPVYNCKFGAAGAEVLQLDYNHTSQFATRKMFAC